MVEGWETQLGSDLNRAMFRPHGAPDPPHVGYDQTSLNGAMFDSTMPVGPMCIGERLDRKSDGVVCNADARGEV